MAEVILRQNSLSENKRMLYVVLAEILERQLVQYINTKAVVQTPEVTNSSFNLLLISETDFVLHFEVTYSTVLPEGYMNSG